jgi:WD40 repeat protein
MLVLHAQLKSIDRLAFSPDGLRLAAAGGDCKPLELLDAGDPTRPSRLLPVELDTNGWNFAFDPASGVLIVADDTALVCFDAEAGTELWRVEPREYHAIAGMDVSRDGGRLTLGFIHQYMSDDGYQLWKLNGRKPPKRRKSMSGTAECTCCGVVLLRGGDLAAFAEYDPDRHSMMLNLVPTTRGRSRLIEVPLSQVVHLAASPDGNRVAVLGPRAVLVWDVTAPGSPPGRVANTSRRAFTGAAFHPSGRHLAVTSNAETVSLYDTATWKVAKTFTWNVGRLRSVAFSPDGTRAAVGSDKGQIVVWDVDL